MATYLATKTERVRNNALTAGPQRVPSYLWLRSVAREVRRIGKLNGHPLTRETIEYAYQLAINELEEDAHK